MPNIPFVVKIVYALLLDGRENRRIIIYHKLYNSIIII